MSGDIDPDFGVLTAEDWEAGRKALGAGSRSILFGTSSKVLNFLVRRFKDGSTVKHASMNAGHGGKQSEEPEDPRPKIIAFEVKNMASNRKKVEFVQGEESLPTSRRVGEEFAAAVESLYQLSGMAEDEHSHSTDEVPAVGVGIGDMLIWRLDASIIVMNDVKDPHSSLKFTVDEFRQFAHEIKIGRFDEVFSVENRMQRWST